MPLPPWLQADLDDGMNPAGVLAVECKLCGKYLGQWGEIDADASDWLLEGLCWECWNEGGVTP